MPYEFPQISDYGDLEDLTAANVQRVDPDAEAPGLPPVLASTGPCIPFSGCDEI